MVRTIAGVFAGLMVVGVVVFGLQSVSTAMYPPPEGVDLLDPANQAVFDSYVQSLPLIGWLIAFGSEVLGGFLGATAAGFVAKSHARFAAAIVVGLALLGSLNNWRMFSHPSWFMIGQILAYPAALWLAWRILPDGVASAEAPEAAEA